MKKTPASKTNSSRNHSNGKAANNIHAMRRADLAYVGLASSEIARDINRDIVLELVRANEPVARAELARTSGLQSSTVSAIVEQLIEERWIVEGGTMRLPRGRHPTLLSLNSDIVILAVDVRPERAIVAVVDLNSRLLSQETILLASNPARAVKGLIACLQRMRDLHPSKSFEGVGLSVPGRVDPETQQLILAPNLHWLDCDIAGEIERELGLKVEMENEANACLIAEVWSGRLDGVRNAVLVAISEGIGTAILSNGQMVTGTHGLAGEFGHVSLNPAGPICGCGRNGCWEMYASTRAATRYYIEVTGRPEEGLPPQQLLNLAAEDDPAAVAALTKQAESLGHGLYLITAALAPEVILFTGDLTSAWTRFGPIVEEQLKRQLLAGTPPRLMIAMNSDFARLRGAAALVLQRHSGYHRSQPREMSRTHQERSPATTSV
jgi:predicted NBD/HSP70 family sugar kinase